MTNKLYYIDGYRRECDTVVVDCRLINNRYYIELESTIFFPEGGGQPGDRGYINSIRVIDTIEEDNKIYHITNEEVEVGIHVIANLDWDKRFANMQQHSGEHIYSGLINSRFGYDNVGFHMSSDGVSVDFNGICTIDMALEIELESNRIIYNNTKISTSYPNKDEISIMRYRYKKEIEGDIRIVDVKGVDTCACCGIHVRYAGEIGVIKVTDVIPYKGGSRISLKIGSIALKDYGKKLESVRAISKLLSAKTDEVAYATENILENISVLKNTIYELQQRILSDIVIKAQDAIEPVVIFENLLDPKLMLKLCDILIREHDLVGIFSGDDDSGYRYVLGSLAKDIVNIGSDFNSYCNGKGGGKMPIVQGNVLANRMNIERFFGRKDYD